MTFISLADMASRVLESNAGQEALLFDGHWYNWGDLGQLARQIGGLIAASGAEPRAPVALIGRNRPETVAALIGLIAQKRTIRMIYAYQSAQSAIAEIERLNPAVVIGMAEDLPEDLLIAMKYAGRAVVSLAEMKASAPCEVSQSHAAVAGLPGEPAIEVLTSGTTGPPKSFPLPFDTIARHLVGKNIRPEEAAAQLEAAPPMLLYLPMGNISGIYTIVPTLVSGQRGMLLDRFNLQVWRDYIVQYRPQYASVIPAAVHMILEAEVSREELASLKSLSAGAAAVDPVVQAEFERRYGIPLLSSYGATEFCGPVAAMTLSDRLTYGDSVATSVGRPLPGASIQVIDPETGAELPNGEQGLIEVMTDRIGDQWIRTSDLGLIDANGFIFHRGRSDGAIMRGGFKVLPERIEHALMHHDAVACVAVTGVADKRLGEVPGAAIQLKPGRTQPSPGELEDVVRQHLPATHVPVCWRFLGELPRTPSHKVDRRAIRQLFA
jgi:acyl-CoA synthetase (AMP-forming)/AMP-acid ligase II